eukprot:gene7676-9139_t
MSHIADLTQPMPAIVMVNEAGNRPNRRVELDPDEELLFNAPRVSIRIFDCKVSKSSRSRESRPDGHVKLLQQAKDILANTFTTLKSEMRG